MKSFKYVVFVAVVVLSGTSFAQNAPTIPSRQIPPSVLMELRLLQNRFELALAQDCAFERCFPKGCTYIDHAVADQPRSGSLPGLGEEAGPGSVARQEYLTRVRCSFAHERSLQARNAQALVKRLESKLSSGWTAVEVSAGRLEPIPSYLRDAPLPTVPKEPEIEEPEAVPPPVQTWDSSVAVRELWLSLLPHFSWMVAIVLLTLAILIMIWGSRKLGLMSAEEQALLAQMVGGPPQNDSSDGAGETLFREDTADGAADDRFVAEQKARWQRRLSNDPSEDEDLRALIASWLRAGEIPLLAKAVLAFPESFPKAFPDGGEYADAKLRLSDYLKTVGDRALPPDVEFYQQLKQHALSAELAGRADAEGLASLKYDFGGTGLAQFVGKFPTRFAALLFAHANLEEQFEASLLLSTEQRIGLANELLQSDRISRQESDYLVELFAAARAQQALPKPPEQSTGVSDYGYPFNAPGALSILLSHLDRETGKSLILGAKQRFSGNLPHWYRDILFPQMLERLTDEAKADLMLEVDANALAGWLSVIAPENRRSLLEGLPASLQTALSAASMFDSRAQQLALYQQSQAELSSALGRQLARSDLPFERLMV